MFYVQDSQLVHINGNFSNFSSDFINRGDFRLTGNLLNEARVFNPGAGIFRLYGSDEQNLLLFQAFGTYDLELNNAAGVVTSGGSSIQLFNHLNFLDGLLTTNFASMISFEPLAYYSNASNFSHINGPMRRMGSTDFTFPVGKGGLLRAPSISDLTGPTGFQVEYFDQGHPVTDTDETLQRINEEEYWEIQQIEGFATGRLTIPYDENSGVFPDLDELEIAFLDTSRWTKIESTNDGATPMVSLTSVDLLRQFKYFTTAQNRILRDQVVISLEQNEECEVSVNWVLPPLFVAERYEIEQGFDSLNFLKIGEVAGDSIPSNDYVLQWFIDPMLYSEAKLYYRLKIYYDDGSFTYSNVASLDNNCIFEDCVLFPNPVSTYENIKLRLESDTEKVIPLKVWSTLGRLLMEYDLEVKEGREDYEILTKRLRLPAATYYLTLGPQKSLKFVVIEDR